MDYVGSACLGLAVDRSRHALLNNCANENTTTH